MSLDVVFLSPRASEQRLVWDADEEHREADVERERRRAVQAFAEQLEGEAAG